MEIPTSIGPDFESTVCYVVNSPSTRAAMKTNPDPGKEDPETMGGRLRKISFRCRATLCSSVHEPRIVSQSWQKAGCRRGCLVHGSVPMPILIPFGHPFGLPRPLLHHVLNCVVLGKLLFKSLGSSRVINQQTARSEVNFVTRFLGCSPRRKDCFCPFFLTLIPRFLRCSSDKFIPKSQVCHPGFSISSIKFLRHCDSRERFLRIYKEKTGIEDARTRS